MPSISDLDTAVSSPNMIIEPDNIIKWPTKIENTGDADISLRSHNAFLYIKQPVTGSGCNRSDRVVCLAYPALRLCEEVIALALKCSNPISKEEVSLFCTKIMQKTFGKEHYQDQWDQDNPR